MDAERAHLAALAERLRAGLRRRGFDTAASDTQIVPLLVGGEDETLALARSAGAAGRARRRDPPADRAAGDVAHSIRSVERPRRGRGRRSARGAGGNGLSYIVTGTDTDVGKTVFAAGLAAALGADYWKPAQAGLEGATDSSEVARLAPRRHRAARGLSPRHAVLAARGRADRRGRDRLGQAGPAARPKDRW